MPSVDALVLSFADPAPVPACVRLGWRRRLVHPLSLRSILRVASAWPASRDVVLAQFGLAKSKVEPTADGGSAVLDVVAHGLGVRTRRDLMRLVRLPDAAIVAVLRQVVNLSTPEDMDALFRIVEQSARSRDEEVVCEDGVHQDIMVVLTKLCVRLEGDGYRDPLSWTPGRILFVSAVLGEHESDASRRRLLDAAVAARAGQTNEKGWRQFTNSLERD